MYSSFKLDREPPVFRVNIEYPELFKINKTSRIDFKPSEASQKFCI